MNKSCETCQYVDVDAEQEPCSVCMHNYMDMYEKENFKNLVEPLKRLAKLQIDKGNSNAVDVCAEVVKWIKSEGVSDEQH